MVEIGRESPSCLSVADVGDPSAYSEQFLLRLPAELLDEANEGTRSIDLESEKGVAPSGANFMSSHRSGWPRRKSYPEMYGMNELRYRE